ncbi:hypothetical protein IAR55_000471 [Kwoniella newhampshirensis]|uniref:Nudix hydrolase domain-containing protein n=1 Tax=Kwoniella newhampshirensis TaxID=1651941 RepID=A0AAW0Z6U6_9TREE
MTKGKSDEHDRPVHPRHVAVAIVFSPTTQKILMITSRAHPHLWILPKGGIEQGETSGEAAVRESYEEAGTPLDLPPPEDDEKIVLLSLPSKKRSSLWHVHVILVDEQLVRKTPEWPESHQRRRAWFTPSSALGKIQEWYTDESAKIKVDPGIEVDENEDGETSAEKKEKRKEKDASGGEERRGKKDKKGGAMEDALRRFAEIKGLELTT